MKTCSRCKSAMDLLLFGKDSKSTDGKMSYCKGCACERVREYKRLHPEKVRESSRKANRKFYRKNKQSIAERSKARNSEPRVKAMNARNTKKARDLLKIEMIESLGGMCACCGITEHRFLSMEHKLGGGNQHRRDCGGSSTAVLIDAKKMGWPGDKFEVLCFNCNLAKHKCGICPHKRKNENCDLS